MRALTLVAIQMPAAVWILGITVGLLYALLATGFVLVYRATRVLNLAHGDLGGFGAVILVYLALDHGFGFWPAFAVAILAGLLSGLVAQWVFIDRLRDAPRIVVLVATLGLAQLILGLNQVIISTSQQAQLLGGDAFPTPFSWSPVVFGTTIRPPAVLTLLAVPVVLAALGIFLRRHRLGIAMRAVAENADGARSLGISPRQTAAIAWGLAGTLSAFAAVLIAANSGSSSNFGVGPSLLVRCLAPALAARLVSLPRAVIAALGIGIVEQFVLFNTGNSGLVDAVLFGFVLIVLLTQRRITGRAATLDVSSWPTTALGRGIGRSPEMATRARRVDGVAVAAVAGLLICVPFYASASTMVVMARVVAFGIAALSVTVLTGHAGQVSLGQWAIAGVGGILAARADAAWGIAVPGGIALAALLAAVASLVVGLPALRLRGLLLTATTVAFSVAAAGWLFPAAWFSGTRGGILVPRPDLVRSDRAFYWLALILLVGALALVSRTTRGRLGRHISAVRENERSAAAQGINVVGVKLTSFLIAGALAGVGGWIAVYADGIGTNQTFAPTLSFLLLMAAVLGGVGSEAGTLLGVFLVIGLSRLLPGEAFLATLGTGIGVLQVLLFLPAGVISLAYLARNRFVVGITAPVAPAVTT